MALRLAITVSINSHNPGIAQTEMFKKVKTAHAVIQKQNI